MEEVKDNCQRPPLDELLRSSKIVSLSKGCLVPEPKNLKTILQGVSKIFNSETKDLPVPHVAIVAVMGPRSSGRSFLTNCLIRNLQFGEEGGWMSDIIRRSENKEPMMKKGFSWDSVSHPNFYKPELGSPGTSGVYLWPEPFLMKSRERYVIVWVMHMHAEPGENVNQLEKFLALVCSRVMDIKWENNDFRLLEQYCSVSSNLTCQEPNAISLEELCKSAVFVIRSKEKPNKQQVLTDDKAKEALLQLISDASTRDGYEEILGRFKHVNLAWIKDSSELLHNNKGVLEHAAMTKKPNALNDLLKKIVDTMTEEAEMDGKIAGGKQALKLENMYEFIINVAQKVAENRKPSDTEQLDRPKVTTANVTTMRRGEGLPESMDKNGFQNFTVVNGDDSPEVKNQHSSDSKQNYCGFDKTEGEKPSQMCQICIAINTVPLDANPKAMHHSADRIPPSSNMETASHPKTPKSDYQSIDMPEDLSTEAQNTASDPSQPSYVPPEMDTDEENGKMDNDGDVIMDSANDDQSPTVTPKPQVKTKVTEEELMHIDCDTITTTTEIAKQMQGFHFDTKKKDPIVTANELETQAAAKAKKEEDKVRKAAEKEARERVKREREEKDRREMEETRAVMEECLKTAVAQTGEKFKPSVQMWIENHFSLKSINEIGTIYAIVLEEVTKEHENVIHHNLRREFISRVDDHCKAECSVALNTITKHVAQIRIGIKKQFDFHGYVSESKLQQVADDEFRKSTKGMPEGFIFDMIKLVIRKLFKIYEEHNKIIMEIEKCLYQEMMPQVVSVYNSQMKRYMVDAPYSPERLQRIHWKLSEKCVDAFKKACSLGNNPEEKTAGEAETLKEELTRAFASFKIANETKVTRMQKDISKIIQNMKTQYNEKVEEILSKHPDGLNKRDLDKLHGNIQVELMKILEIEIKRKIRQDEPLENHKRVLQSHIDDYWPTIVAENVKNIESKKKRDEEEKKKREQEEDKRKLEGKARSQAATFKSVLETCVDGNGYTDKSSKIPKTVQKQQHSGKPLPPLIFHLQSSRVTMAMNVEGRATILENEFSQTHTPPCVALTSDNRFISQVLNHVTEGDGAKIGDLSWSIADFFANDDLNWNKTINIDQVAHQISDEFLMGFLFRKLKETVENREDGHCSVAVIDIPFWLSSSQRLKVKHSATIAGFTEANLINESSAAAYNFAVSKNRYAADVLIICENFDRVDTFVYSYSTLFKPGKLKMVGHSSSYGDEADKDNYNYNPFKAIGKVIQSGLNHFSNGCKYIFNALSQGPGVKGKDDKATKCVRKATERAIEQAKPKSKRAILNEFFYVCENWSKWGDTFYQIGHAHARKATDIEEVNAVIRGAMFLASKPKDIGSCISDMFAFDILRYKSGIGGVLILDKTHPLPPDGRKDSSEIEKGCKVASYYQLVFGEPHHIIEIFAPSVELNQWMDPRIEITNEAIVQLKQVVLHSNSYNMRTRSKSENFIPLDQLKIKSPNLSLERVGELASLLDFIVSPSTSEDPALAQARADLLEKCREMADDIEKNKFKIKSSLGKDMVLSKIAVAKDFAEHSNSALEGIQKQMEILKQLCEKYAKKDNKRPTHYIPIRIRKGNKELIFKEFS